MGKIYRTRENAITAVDTKTQLSTIGSETAPGPLLVPNSAKRIIGLTVVSVGDLSAANDASYIARLEGPGLQNGPECVVAGADADQVATGGQYGTFATFIPVNFPVVQNQEILIYGEMCGEDIGNANMAVTVIFDDGVSQAGAETRTLTVQGDINSVDTLTQLTKQGSVAAPSRVTPNNCKRIAMIIAAISADGAAEGAQNYIIRLGGGAVKNGEQVIAIAGSCTNTVQAGSDTSPITSGLFVLKNVDIEVEASEVINIAGEMVGADGGDSTMAVTLVFTN